jgi:hypothetical protein
MNRHDELRPGGASSPLTLASAPVDGPDPALCLDDLPRAIVAAGGSDRWRAASAASFGSIRLKRRLIVVQSVAAGESLCHRGLG